MENVKITGLTITEGMKPSEKGTQIIAFFNCDVGVFSIVGCTLIRTARSGVAVRLPKLDNAFGAVRSVKLNCDATRNAMMQAARDVYRIMGGTDAEWTGRSEQPGEPVVSHYIPNEDGRSRIVEVEVHKRRIEPDEGENREGLETFLGTGKSAGIGGAQADGEE